MITDKERLDFLQSHLGEYSGKVICRESGTGRGWRLHETLQPGAVKNVRQAIDEFMQLDINKDDPEPVGNPK